MLVEPSAPLSACDWQFAGEGAASLVVRFVSSSFEHPSPFDGSVLRLRKENVPAAREHDEVEGTIPARERIRLAQAELCTLLCAAHRQDQNCTENMYRHCLKWVPVDEKFLQEVEKRCRESRDSTRLSSRRQLDCQAKWAELLPDATICPCNHAKLTPGSLWHHSAHRLAIELKPKCGLERASSPFGGAPVACRYCIQQTMKLENGSISQRSRYCPLDLFSEDRHRMERALNAMIEVPQNNFRILVSDSSLQGGDAGRSLDDALLSFQAAGFWRGGRAEFVGALASLLKKSAILSSILHVQAFESSNELDHLSRSHVMKDCSLIVAFCVPRDSNNTTVRELHTSLTLVDLDPKPVSKVSYYRQLEKELIKRQQTQDALRHCSSKRLFTK